jgi:histidyl-tRNA synthetase
MGEKDPAADAELIALLIDTLRAFGLTANDFVIRLSSRNAWADFYQAQSGRPEAAYEFYQVIDKLEREKPELSQERLKTLGFSLERVRSFIEAGKPTEELEKVMTNLRARGLGDFVKVDYLVIRGLAYYTGPVFEAFDVKGEFRAIAGGGRYDNLVKLLSDSKVDLPALGFGMGDVVLLELLKERGLLPKFNGQINAYVLIEDELLRPDSLAFIQKLREAGLAIEYSLAPMKSDKQFKRALELKAERTLRLEKTAEGQITTRLKDLRSRQEMILSPGEALNLLIPAN